MGRPCRACGASNCVQHFEVDDWDILRCEQCQSLTTDCEMHVDAAQSFYGHGYYHGGDYADYEAAQSPISRNFERFARRLQKINSDGLLLDVGCAYGYFMDVAQRTWEVEGIDVSPAAIAACRARFGSKVKCGDLLQTPYAVGRFDWVTVWDTIEHLDDPRAYLRRFSELLKPGGHVAITTGDVTSVIASLRRRRWRLLTPPSHLTFFSRRGMRLALECAGLEPVWFGTAGYSRSVEFLLHRVMQRSRLPGWVSKHPRVTALTRSATCYVNLLDIMFVIARKPIVS